MRRLALLFVLVVTAAGCGSKDAAPRVETPRGFTTRSVADPELSIALPKSWRSYDAHSSGDERDAAVRRTIDSMRKPDSPIKLIGIAPSLGGAFVTNMNVLQTEVPSELSFDDLAKNEARQIKAAAKVKAIQQDETRVPAGRALRLRYRAQSGALIHQYFVRHEEFLYILTYTTSRSGLSRYAKIFDMSAHTFQVG